MPKQEVFLKRSVGQRTVRVLKTYDESFARDAFDESDERAQEHLWSALCASALCDPDDLPPAGDPDREDWLWDEVLEAAREDGNLLSFFVVEARDSQGSRNLYASPDWPSAEAYALRELLPTT